MRNKYEMPTLAIRNAGESANMKVRAFNKLSANRKGKCLEIPHYAKLRPLFVIFLTMHAISKQKYRYLFVLIIKINLKPINFQLQ